MPTEIEDYLFDLRGYLLVENALDQAELNALNTIVDELSPSPQQEAERAALEREAAIAAGADFGTERHGFGSGLNGDVMDYEPFQRLIDHPAWLSHLERYIGSENPVAFYGGGCILRWPGQGSRLHSGGDQRRQETQFRFHNNEFRCGMINMILALNDCGERGGNTSIVPGSHKANLPHPEYSNPDPRSARGWKRKAQPGDPPGGQGGYMDGVEGAVEITMRAGDSLLFVDCLTHGSTKRQIPGARRAVIFRYAPRWTAPPVSQPWMAQLTDEQKALLATQL